MLLAGGDRWFTADEAIAAGYAHEKHEPAEHAERETAFYDGLLYHLPTAGPYAGVITAHLRRVRHTPSAPAAQHHPENSRMNWKTLALALGIALAANADDAAARAAIVKHLNQADDVSDDTLAQAYSDALKASSTQPASQSGQTAANPAQASGQPTRDEEVRGLFAIAMDGQSDVNALRKMQARALISNDPVDTIRRDLMAHLASGTPTASGSVPSMQMGTDQRDKTREAATGWLLARAGILKGDAMSKAVAGNPFYRMNLHDMARACLEDAGIETRRMHRMDVIQASITTSTSDFPNIFENALHKTLLAGFELQKPSWDRIAKTTTLSDFRPHIRYRSGSVGDLEVRGEDGEYRTLKLNDAERESIQAKSRGGILNVSREMLVNDDMSVFTDLAMMLGTTSARTLDKALFALFAMNSGGGPLMGDGLPLFHADHKNIAATAALPTVVSVEAMRVQMASQMDVSANDFLDLRPEIWLGPLSIGGQARVVNNSTYDPDASTKLQRHNISANLFRDIVDTPRLTGTPWYVLANPNIEPVFEVGFLDGIQTPQIEQKEAWTQAGMSWRVLYEFGVAATGFRGIIKNPGAAA